VLFFRFRVVAGCALLAWPIAGGFAFADGPGEPLSLQPQTTRPVPGAADSEPSTPEEAPRLLMGFLSQTSIGPTLEKSRIDIYGWIEGSYEYNFNVRNHTANAGRAYDAFENNKGYLNQFDLTFERNVNPGPAWDVGGRVDIMYGSDSRFTTSSDFLDKQGDRTSFDFGRQEAWLDIPQAYVDIALPVLQGVRLRVGKFEFFKAIDPNANAFYTHPFEYVEAFPYTLTGISAYAPVTPAISVETGISRGWDQTFTDNNSAAIDGFGLVGWNISERARIVAAFITGPEQYRDDGHFTTGVDLTFLYNPSDQFAFVLDTTFGHQAGAVRGDFPGSTIAPPTFVSFGDANWYGLTGTAAYKVNDLVVANGRLEWYRDEEGYTEGFPGQVNLYEATVGVSITPLHSTAIGDNFILRPEVRYDYASRPFFNVSSPRHDQLTVAIDAIFNF
jgi:hypothetical protein